MGINAHNTWPMSSASFTFSRYTPQGICANYLEPERQIFHENSGFTKFAEETCKVGGKVCVDNKIGSVIVD
jgi:hypothetical protein